MQEIEDMRPDRDNAFYDNYEDIVNYLNDNDEDELFDAFKAPSILMLILLCLVFITFIALFFVCCCESEGNVNKCWVVIAWILFIIFLGLFTVLLVFLGRAQSDSEDVLCNIFLVPSGVIDGLKDEGNEFVGLANLKQSYSDFKTDMNNIPTVSTEIDTIVGKNVGNLASSTVVALKNFVAT